MLKKVILVLAILVVLLVAAYFVVTSSAFVRGVVLPRVGGAMHASITAEDASLSPFSSLSLRGVRVVTQGETPLATVASLTAKYSLMDILRGKLAVQELTVESPVIQIVPTSPGQDTLSPILNAGDAKPANDDRASKPPVFAIGKVSINNGSIRYVSSGETNGQRTFEATKLNVSLDQWVTGQAGKLAASADLRSTVAGANGGAWQGKLQAQFDLALDASSSLRSVKGAARAAVDQASGSFASLAGFGPVIDVEITPAEIRSLAVRFEQNGKALGGLTASGPFDLAKREGKIRIQADGLDRQVLNPLGASAGIDFGATRLNASADVEIGKSGSLIHAVGSVQAARLSVARAGKTSPELELNSKFDVTADTAAKVLQLAALNLQGTQQGRAILTGVLSAPMSLAWGTGSAAPADATFQISVVDLGLTDWKAFLGDTLTSGRLTATARVASGQAGKVLKIDSEVQLRDLGVAMNPQPFTQGELQAKLQAQVTEFSKLALDSFKVSLTRGGQPALAAQGSGSFDSKEGSFGLKSSLEMVGERLFGTGSKQPVTLSVATEGAMRPNGSFELKRLLASLPNTAKATPNEITLSGQLSGSTASDRKGAFTLQSPGLDLTALYETFANPNAPAAAPTASTESVFPKTEPAAKVFPVRSVTLDMKLAKVFVGEVALADVQGLLLVEGGRVHLVPFQFSLNGAPVRAGVDLDLGVAGSVYDLSLQLSGVPVEPIVNTFNPAMKNQVQGRLFTTAQIKGAGVTGANLKKSLSAQTQISLTNANIRVVPEGHKVWLLPIDINLISHILNVPELTSSPITQVDVRAAAAAGRVTLEETRVKGDAFMAEARGAIQLEDNLDLSAVKIPLDLSLARSVAARANLLASDTPTNAVYSKLPPFITVVGTLAKVDTQIDKVQVAKLTARAAMGLLGGGATNVVQSLGGAVGNLGNTLGNLLGGDKTGKTNAASGGNTNKPGVLNPLNLFKKK